MKSFWMLAAGLLFLPLVGCTHETTPDEAAKEMATGMLENKPQLYWETLPPSYQKDVDGLVKDFANEMDAEVWDSGFDVAKKVVLILQEKKEYILANPWIAQAGVDKKVLDENWAGIVKVLSTIVNSDLNSIDKLKHLDIQEFLSTTGVDVMQQASAVSETLPQVDFVNQRVIDLKQAKFTLVKIDGNTATVRMEIPGQTKRPDDMQMVKVEGKWILKDVADNWAESMKKAREALAKLDTEARGKNKEKIMANIKMVDAQLNLLLDSKSSEDFNGKLTAMAMMVAMGFGNGTPPASLESEDINPSGLESNGRRDPFDGPIKGTPVEKGSLPNSTTVEAGTSDSDPLFDTPASKPAVEDKGSYTPSPAKAGPAEAAPPEASPPDTVAPRAEPSSDETKPE
jgi:hypothetical protein